jgi:hypothetical protein
VLNCGSAPIPLVIPRAGADGVVSALEVHSSITTTSTGLPFDPGKNWLRVSMIVPDEVRFPFDPGEKSGPISYPKESLSVVDAGFESSQFRGIDTSAEPKLRLKLDNLMRSPGVVSGGINAFGMPSASAEPG